MATWRDRLPTGMHVTNEGSGGFVISLGLPTGPDGMFALQCPVEAAHKFGVPLEFAYGDERGQVTCPHCAHRGARNEFLTDDARRRVRSAAEAAGHAYVQDKAREMLAGLERSTRGNPFVQVSAGPRSAPPVTPLFSYEVPEARRTMRHDACGLSYAVFGLAVFCPRCGATAPHDAFVELIEVQRRALTVFDDLPADKREAHEASGVVTRTYEGAIKDTFGALETFLRDEFTARVPAAATVVKGRGNVFQRLSDADALYREHLGIALAGRSRASWRTAVEGMALRHVLVHRNGVIDERYAAVVPAAASRVAQRVHVDRDTADAVLAAASVVAAAATRR